ncbi:sulfite exporter TauE/SafE family protein, partial [bacterium]|nr:sulfite exporter TauE/SafE family protein [bacterium]
MNPWRVLVGVTFLAALTGLGTAAAARPEFNATAVASVDRLTAGQSFHLAVVLELPSPWHVNAQPVSLPGLIPTELTWAGTPPVTIGPVTYPPGDPVPVVWADQPVRLYSGRVVLFASGSVPADAAPGPVTLTGRLRFQACDDNVCYAPQTLPVEVTTRVVPATEPAQAQHINLFAAYQPAPTRFMPLSAAAATPPDNSIAALVAKRGWLIALVVVFLGGLALNLTPCVYPMIAITVSYFGGQGERQVGRAFAGALAYCLGIVLTYSALGLVAALTGGLFGALLQSPAVLVVIAALLVVLALSMFGLFELRPPSFLLQKATGLSARAGLAGTFLLGALVGVVAAPCLAPILVALLAFVGQRGDPWLGWWLFFVLACGLGLPYMVLGTFSGLLARLPKSGYWMVWVKRVLGVLLLLVAAWFVRPIFGRAPFPPSLLPWQPYTTAAVTAADRPVLIDFMA